MRHLELVVKFINDNQGLIDGGVNLKTNLEILANKINSLTARHSDMKEVFVKHGMDLHLDCPECGSPVLLEMISCPYCSESLLNKTKADEKVIEVKAEPTEKKKRSKEEILETFQNTEEEIEELMDAEEVVEEVKTKPKTKKEFQISGTT